MESGFSSIPSSWDPCECHHSVGADGDPSCMGSILCSQHLSGHAAVKHLHLLHIWQLPQSKAEVVRVWYVQESQLCYGHKFMDGSGVRDFRRPYKAPGCTQPGRVLGSLCARCGQHKRLSSALMSLLEWTPPFLQDHGRVSTLLPWGVNTLLILGLQPRLPPQALRG